MSLFQTLFEKKSNLFTIITIAVIGIVSVPIIFPHILHPGHFLHISLHIGELILAVFIGILSIMAYYRMRTKRLLLTMAAFLTFITVAVVNLIEAVWSSYFYVGELSLLEISHILIFGTIGMLALGAFRND
jgi:hypothetical protein